MRLDFTHLHGESAFQAVSETQLNKAKISTVAISCCMLTLVRLMFPESMVHDLVVSFPEHPQGREAGDVVFPAQLHLLGAVNLQAFAFIGIHTASVSAVQAAFGGRGCHYTAYHCRLFQLLSFYFCLFCRHNFKTNFSSSNFKSFV